MESIVKLPYGEIRFTDEDVVNPDDFIPADEINYYNVRPWLLHDHGYTLCVVFATNLQEALDEACDAGKLDRYQVLEENLADYGADEEGISRLGNAGESFDIESMGIIELPNPKWSFCAMFNSPENTFASILDWSAHKTPA